MRTHRFLLRILFLHGMLLSTVASAQVDPLTLPYEVRLNERQPPDTVLKTIGIAPGMIIGEVGAGRGRYTVQMASRLGPDGEIYANDIRQDALRYLKNRCDRLGFRNVKTVLGSVTETNLPSGALDMILMVNVVHCLDQPVRLLKNMGASLKPGGRIVIVEGCLDKAPEASGEWFTRDRLLKIFADAGYILDREETFLPKDNIYFLRIER